MRHNLFPPFLFSLSPSLEPGHVCDVTTWPEHRFFFFRIYRFSSGSHFGKDRQNGMDEKRGKERTRTRAGQHTVGWAELSHGGHLFFFNRLVYHSKTRLVGQLEKRKKNLFLDLKKGVFLSTCFS